jgi:ABC-type transport system substrate-binding protein
VVLRGGALAGAGLALGACTQAAAPAASPTSGAVVAPTSGAAGAPAATATAARPAQKYGGTLRADASTSRPENVDVHQAPSFHLPTSSAGLAYSRLVKFKTGPDSDPGALAPVGDLAESWEQADDLTYVFKLRGGVKFQNIAPVNGRELVAADVVYSYTRQKDLRINAAFLAAIEKVEAPDARTVKLTLGKPDADFLINLSNGRNVIVAKEAVDVKGDLREGPTIGTGPWIHLEYRADGDTLQRNPDYFIRGLPYVDRLEFRRIADSATIVAAFRGKELDAQQTAVTPLDAERVKAESPEVNLVTNAGSLGTGWEMGIKCDRPPTSDLRVRQAINKAIDRQQIIDTVAGGKGSLIPGIILASPDWWLPADELKRLYQRDLAAARRLLQEAGAAGFELEITVPNFGEQYITAAELMAAQLGEAGMRVRLKPIPSAEYNQRILSQGDYQAYIAPAQPGGSTNADLMTKHHSTGARHSYKLNNAQLDEMIDRQAVMTKDPQGRVRLLQEIQRRIIDLSYHLGILAPSSFTLMWPYVKDFNKGVAWGQGTEGGHLTTVWLDK